MWIFSHRMAILFVSVRSDAKSEALFRRWCNHRQDRQITVAGRECKNQENPERGTSSIRHGSPVRRASLVQRPFVRRIEKKETQGGREKKGWLCLRWKHRSEPRGRLEPRQIIYWRPIRAFPRIVPPSSSRPSNEATAALLSAIRECRWPAGLLLYLLRGHGRTREEERLPTDRNDGIDGRRGTSDCAVVERRIAGVRMIQPIFRLLSYRETVIQPSRKKGYTVFFSAIPCIPPTYFHP